uniref:Uncharacterized protein n=1 Tax=Candidatus Kentrum sp. UNK TaxID=2126344 RepID=A0A451ANZ4_9GAMM|nr:MAG: hypothetical protein BECKUNK1418G_GA0071005_11633 [Candidatus Kentron sp. UNK]
MKHFLLRKGFRFLIYEKELYFRLMNKSYKKLRTLLENWLKTLNKLTRAIFQHWMSKTYIQDKKLFLIWLRSIYKMDKVLE